MTIVERLCLPEVEGTFPECPWSDPNLEERLWVWFSASNNNKKSDDDDEAIQHRI
jgi:hypothetical protein